MQFDCAPIAVLCYNRLGLLKRTLKSLTRCREFSRSPVFVFSDGAKPGSPNDCDAVAALRGWLSAWCQLHGATLEQSGENIGLRPSIVGGVTSLLNRYDRVIVLEDDIVVSRCFLTFMNRALEQYCRVPDVLQVSGYMVPHNRTLPEIGFLRAPGSWGWGTWKRAWAYYNDNAAELREWIEARDVTRFNINGSYDYFSSLCDNADGKISTWVVRWYASMFVRNGLAVYPTMSHTRNIGFVAEGTNCKPGAMANVFFHQGIAKRPLMGEWPAKPVAETDGYLEALESFYRRQGLAWCKPSLRDRLVRRALALLRGVRFWAHD